MKTYPSAKNANEQSAGQGPTRTEEVTRIIAICIAFASVFFFFAKLLFF